jgi:hypothetical protein
LTHIFSKLASSQLGYGHLSHPCRYFTNRAQMQQHKPTPLDMLQDPQYAALSRMTFGLVGQDIVLDEFYRSIAMHRLAHPDSPLVFILCGPSGHGKTLFARKSKSRGTSVDN